MARSIGRLLPVYAVPMQRPVYRVGPPTTNTYLQYEQVFEPYCDTILGQPEHTLVGYYVPGTW